MKQIKGGITVVPGFEAAAAAAQIKYEGRTDMALIYSSVPCCLLYTSPSPRDA